MVPRCPTKNLGPIGSAVLTFIGYKQTDRQTDKPNLYIDKNNENAITRKKKNLGWFYFRPTGPRLQCRHYVSVLGFKTFVCGILNLSIACQHAK